MPNKTTLAEALALSRQLAPVLAAIPRTNGHRGHAIPEPRSVADGTLYGSVAVHARIYLDMHEPKPSPTEFSLPLRISASSFLTSIYEERALRADPVRLARRTRLEAAAAWFLDRHATPTLAQRRRFQVQHGYRTSEFRHALRRVGAMRQLGLEVPAQLEELRRSA